MTRKIIAIIVLGLILLASLLACGYFGAKTIHRSRQRRAAMAAYEKKDYETAERLLRQYIGKDPNSEPEIVALANIYHEFGNIGFEAQLWQRAYSLNQLNADYRKQFLSSALRSARYDMIYAFLGYEIQSGVTLPEQELSCYVLSSYRSGHPKDGDAAYRKAVKNDPEVFHKSELGRMVEFIMNYSSLSENEREEFLSRARTSEDPVIRFEALYTDLMRVREIDEDGTDVSARMEAVLQEIVETNYYVGTPLLADFYYSEGRFPEVVSVSDPYLKKIDDRDLYLLLAESCVFTGDLDKLKELEQKLREKQGVLHVLSEYCEILIAYMENDDAKLSASVRKSGKLISSPLSRFICLRAALAGDSYSEILSAAQDVFSHPSLDDLQDRALLACLDYLAGRMDQMEKRSDISQLADLAKILAGYAEGDELVTTIVLSDQSSRGLAKEADLLKAQAQFPGNLLLLKLAVEHLILNGGSDRAMPLIEQALENEVEDTQLSLLHMLALDQIGNHDEAEKVFRRLLERSEFDLSLLARYFAFCWNHDRAEDLSSMADRLEGASDDQLKPLGQFFRAAALLKEDDEDGKKKAEALRLLASSPTDNPDFALFAANRLNEADMLDEAEAKYKAIRKTYSAPGLILVNLSEVYKARGDSQQALAAAKEAYLIEKQSILPAFIYAMRLSEAERYEEAVAVLNFPNRAVEYRQDVVDLWADCMRKVIENSIRDHKYMPAEEQCKHLLVIVPGDEFGQAKLNEVNEILHPKKDREKEASEAAAS